MASIQKVLEDTFHDSIAPTVLEFLCESIDAGGVELEELLGPYLLDAGLADDATLAAVCASVAAQVGAHMSGMDASQSRPARLTPTIATRVQAHQALCEEANLPTAHGQPTVQQMTLNNRLKKAKQALHGRPAFETVVFDVLCDARVDEVELSVQCPQPMLPSWALDVFADRRLELRRTLSTPAEVAAMIRAGCAESMLKGKSHESALFAKLADVIEADEMDAALVVAGGEEVLIEKLRTAGRKRENFFNVCRQALRMLKESSALDAVDGYWQLLEEGSDEDRAMLEAFAGSRPEPVLRRVLQPLGREDVAYSVHLCRQNDVASVHHAVRHAMGAGQGRPFLVASIVATEKPKYVRQNLIYFAEAGYSPTLLCSVDFARHGTAPSGHWHLNLTPSWDQVEHWGVRGAVFHGSWSGCPMWWLVIPAGLEFRERPLRLQHLF